MSSPLGDDDPTVIKPSTSPRPPGHAQAPAMTSGPAHDSAAPSDTHALPLGTRLGKFELTERIGEGGFGIVYLAWDHSLDRKVALKEYMPGSIAVRAGDTLVRARSERHREAFEVGLKAFIKEAKALAQFDHPSLVKVYEVWEVNGTAYFAMPLLKGVTLKDTVRALAEPPDEAWLLGLLSPLTEALRVIHAKHWYHRDIAPDNVMLLAGSGKPLLLDFGAARHEIGDMTETLMHMLKPGYAPVEQYGEVPGATQGPWTDVYALGAVVYWAITGKPPQESVKRILSDSCVPLAELAAGRYSQPFLQAIDRALVVRPEQRTQTVDAFRLDLGLDPEGFASPAAPPQWVDPEATVIRPHRPGSGGPKGSDPRRTTGARNPTIPTAGSATLPRFEPSSAPSRQEEMARSGHTVPPQASDIPASGTEAKAGRRRVVFGAAAVGAAVVAAGLWFTLRQPSVEPTPPTSPAPSPRIPSPVPPEPPPAPRSPAEAIALAKHGSDPSVKVSLSAPASTLVAGRDALRLSVTTSESGYVYLFGHRAGSDELEFLHPKTLTERDRIDAGGVHEVPVSAWDAASPLPGTWRLLALVSRQPRDLSAAGWRAQTPLLVRGFGQGDAPTPAFWGSAVCAPDAKPCDSAYGVEELSITVIPQAAPTPPPQPDTKPAPPSEKVERPKSAGRPGVPGNSAECARILQRISLGDSSPELLERYNKLGCR